MTPLGLSASTVSAGTRRFGVAFWVVALLIPTVIAVYSYEIHRGWTDSDLAGRVADLTLPAAAFIAVLAMTSRAWRSAGRVRVAWGCMALGSLASMGAELFYTVFHLVLHLDDPPAPGPQDVAYLARYALLIVALLLFPAVGAGRLTRWRTLLDGLLVAGSVTTVSWAVVLGPAFDANEAHTSQDLLNGLYPLLDCIVAAVSMLLLLRATGRARNAVFLVVVASVVGTAANYVNVLQDLDGSYQVGGLLDATWIVDHLLFALAALAPVVRAGRRPDEGATPLRTILLPYLALAAAVAAVFFSLRHGDVDHVLLGLAAFVVGVLLTRQALTAVDNARLAGRLSEAETVLRAREEYFRSLVHGASEVLSIIDEAGRLQWVSPSVLDLLGVRAETLGGHRLLAMVHPEDRAEVLAAVRHAMGPDTTAPMVACRVARADGGWCHTETVVTDHRATAAVGGIVLHTRDATERRLLEQRLTAMAFTDDLTALANRARITQRLADTLETHQRDGGVALLFCDLDGFKGVNDSLGHSAGDALLIEAGRRLVACVRAEDVVARLGGDEFAVLLERTGDVAEAQAAARRIGAALSRPYQLGSDSVVVTSSIGIAISAPGDDVETLLRNADLAMYRAKAAGRSRAAVYDPGMHVAALRRLEIERDLRRAMDNRELWVAYQPVVNLRTGRVDGVEALLRWDGASGPVAPLDFIPVAEETGLIVHIGQWVLDTACAQLAAWREAGHELQLSVNLSARQLLDQRLPAAVAGVLVHHGLPADVLTLELTESVLVHEQAPAALTRLRALGVHLALDDFGTGWSSLSYLKDLPVDTVKIDRSFIGERALTRAVIALSRELGLGVIAEGVETQAQATWLASIGCLEVQGWLYSPAVRPEAVVPLLDCWLGRPIPEEDQGESAS
jgi:diguanylate cyclase (GGDEF)-like protein/PAS domain S-box-containing protein